MDKGFMKQFYNIDGEEVIKWVFIEKDIVCSFGSFVKNMPSNENIQAIKNSHIYYINKTDFQKLYTKHDSIKNLWISQIQSFLIGLEERIYIMISKQAKARYEFFLTHYPVHARQIPLQYLASLLGIAPQHLSRIRKS
jgi:CRP-like cAMP-binding protein